MKIGELTKRYGVSSRRIRHYEKIGLLTSSREPFSNYRNYDNSVCDRLETIKLLRELGFSLKEIKQVLDFPKDTETQTIFNDKSVAMQNEIAIIANRVQILKAIANIISEHGLESVNLASVIRECSYIHSKNERMIPVLNDKVLVQIGTGLIPIFDGKDSPVLNGVKPLRDKLSDELGITVPAIRFRDETDLDEMALSIKIDGKQVCNRTYASLDTEKTAADVLSLLESCLRDNLNAFTQ